MSPELITSQQNPRVKWLRSLHKNSTRRSEGLAVVEGHKETSLALAAGWTLHTLFICPDLAGDQFSTLQPLRLARDVFARVSYREDSDGIIGVFHAPQPTLESLSLGANPLLLVLEGVEKPGNLGAVVRTADGAGIDAVIVCDPRCDIWNPNAIRASVGTIFSKPICAASNEAVHEFLVAKGITPFAALLSSTSLPYTSTDFRAPSALLLGTEHDGLSQFWQDRSQPIIIPMLGVNDSLNVSNAAAVLAYEALRQRTAQS